MGKQQSDNVNHDAHLWGSLFGLVFTFGLLVALKPGILLVALKPGILPHIVNELKNFSLFGREGAGEVLTFLIQSL